MEVKYHHRWGHEEIEIERVMGGGAVSKEFT